MEPTPCHQDASAFAGIEKTIRSSLSDMGLKVSRVQVANPVAPNRYTYSINMFNECTEFLNSSFSVPQENLRCLSEQ